MSKQVETYRTSFYVADHISTCSLKAGDSWIEHADDMRFKITLVGPLKDMVNGVWCDGIVEQLRA